MHKASVEFALALEVVEGHPVRPVEVSVAAEHLLVHVLDLGLEALGETRGFAEPVVGVRGLAVGGRDERGCRSEGIRGEEAGIESLAGDPGLYVLHVLSGGEVDWVAVGVDPRVDSADVWVSDGARGSVSEEVSPSSAHGGTCLFVAAWAAPA